MAQATSAGVRAGCELSLARDHHAASMSQQRLRLCWRLTSVNEDEDRTPSRLNEAVT
jgi:hypothetical protein